METRQSLHVDPRVSNPGLIGCQNNLIPSSDEPSRYDISATSIHRNSLFMLMRQLMRQQIRSGNILSVWMLQILESFQSEVCWKEKHCKSSNNMTSRHKIALIMKLDKCLVVGF